MILVRLSQIFDDLLNEYLPGLLSVYSLLIWQVAVDEHQFQEMSYVGVQLIFILVFIENNLLLFASNL